MLESNIIEIRLKKYLHKDGRKGRERTVIGSGCVQGMNAKKKRARREKGSKKHVRRGKLKGKKESERVVGMHGGCHG